MCTNWPWLGAWLCSTGRWGLFPALHFQVPLKILAKETKADDSMYEICVILILQMLKGKDKVSGHL